LTDTVPGTVADATLLAVGDSASCRSSTAGIGEFRRHSTRDCGTSLATANSLRAELAPAVTNPPAASTLSLRWGNGNTAGMGPPPTERFGFCRWLIDEPPHSKPAA